MRRLTFTVRQGKIDLISDQQVQMTMPPQPAAPRGATVPFWYELRDGADAVLHRLPARDPIPVDSEVFSDDPNRSIRRAAVVPPEVVFTVVVPDLPSAAEIRLMRAPPPGGDPRTRAPGEAVEVGRFRLGMPGKKG
jgi:hypothetical protein